MKLNRKHQAKTVSCHGTITICMVLCRYVREFISFRIVLLSQLFWLIWSNCTCIERFWVFCLRSICQYTNIFILSMLALFSPRVFICAVRVEHSINLIETTTSQISHNKIIHCSFIFCTEPCQYWSICHNLPYAFRICWLIPSRICNQWWYAKNSTNKNK